MLDQLKPHEGTISTTQPSCGAYIIHHVKTKKMYVGSSGNVGYRTCWHKSVLKNDNHINRDLQDAYNDDDRIYIVYYVVDNREVAYDLEQALLDEYFPTGRLFNHSADARASTRGMELSEETKQRLRGLAKGLKRTPEQKERLAEANRGKKRTEEQKMSASLSKSGVPLTSEARAKIDKLNQSKRAGISVDGIVYYGQRQAAEALGITKGALDGRIKSPLPKWDNYFYI